MNELAHSAVRAALEAGADYADARSNHVLTEELTIRNGNLSEAGVREDSGLGVRVLKNGCWGFSAAPARDVTTARELGKRAVNAAGSLAPARVKPVRLSAEKGAHEEYRTPYSTNPFGVALSRKLDLLRRCDESMKGRDETVVREAMVSSRREEQWQVSSEGADVHQVLMRCGGGIVSTAAANGTTERRSWPSSFGGNYKSAGWEFVESLDLPSHGERMRDEAVELCFADVCPAGKRDLILMGNQLMLQIHESVGHPNEIDRVYGHEVDLAGSSFATTEKLDQFQYGSKIVNLVADSTIAGGLDTRGYDDDASPSKRWHVVEDGIFRGYHTSREWAGALGQESSRATNRAEGWFNPPIIRITNLSLMPGTWKLDDLIADTEDGVLCDTVKMWSIDQRRLNFQFTTELGREIKNGKLGRMLRKPTYQGTTPEFWRSCDAICDESEWELWGVANCGKGNPMQVAEMSHGASPARFRGMTFVE